MLWLYLDVGVILDIRSNIDMNIINESLLLKLKLFLNQFWTVTVNSSGLHTIF